MCQPVFEQKTIVGLQRQAFGLPVPWYKVLYIVSNPMLHAWCISHCPTWHQYT